MEILKRIILAILIVSASSITHAQIGKFNVNKTKEKVKKKVDSEKDKKTDITSDSDSNTGTSDSGKKKSDTPAYDSEDPVYKAYSTAKNSLKFAKSTIEGIEWKSNIEGSNESVLKDLTKVKSNLAILKDNGEDTKQYYAEFQKEYDRIEALRATDMNNFEVDEAYEDKAEAFYNWAKLGWDIKDSTIQGSYTSYNTFRLDFETQRAKKFASSYMQKTIKGVDNYLTVEVYEDIPYYTDQVDRLIKKMYALNERNEATYLLGAKSFESDIKELFVEINYYDKFLLENKVDINIVKEKLNKEKVMLDEYIGSGKYDEHVAKYRQELIDAVRLRPAGMSNSKYISMAKNSVDKGSATRAVIASNRWIVSRNEFGYPKYKYLSVDIAVTHDGKCWLAFGHVVRDYQGGGVYGAEYFSYWGIQEEMNCDNTTK